jgi:tetratricopeptide (TPR) repeat protein
MFLQGQVERLQIQAPSPRARELAAQIPSDAEPYALALKAIAESRFDDARVLLGKAQQAKEVELVLIYQARGETETYAGRYGDAVGWYEKALALNPNDPTLLSATALALLDAGDYAKAEPLFTRALTIWEQALGPEHPDVALGLHDLAGLYRTQEKYAKAEPLLQRVLTIRERALGPEHPDIAFTLNGYVVLLQKMGREAEAANMEVRAKTILERGNQQPRAQ